MNTLRKILQQKSNDYSHLEKKFWQDTGQQLLSKKNFLLSLDQLLSLSIIIPSFNSNDSLEKTLFSLSCQPEIVSNCIEYEIIVIDDNSKIPIQEVTGKFEKKLNIISLRTKHHGAGPARNLGIKVARNDIVLFLDSDVVLSNNLLQNHLFVHKVLSDPILLVGFREHVKKNDHRLTKAIIKNGIPASQIDISNDFRICKEIKPEWGYNECSGSTAKITQETNHFKNFGHAQKRILWTLPDMALTFCMSCRRQDLIDIGGCPEYFSGWGFNDVSIAAKLIGKGHYIIPNYNSRVLHILHEFRTSNKPGAKLLDYQQNKQKYELFLDKKIKEVYTPLFL